MTHVHLRIGDEEREFDVTRQGDRFHVGNVHVGNGSSSAQVTLLHRDNGRLLLEIRHADGTTRRVRLAGARQGDARRLWIDGRALTATRVRRTATARDDAPGSLAATIPAVVSQILVAPGDLVAAGDKLILLESMKMVIPIQAPYGGRITHIHCAPGDSVPAGLALLEIEAE